MNQIYKDFINLYSFALREKESGAKIDSTEIRQIFSLAESHCVFSMVYDLFYSSLNERNKGKTIYKKYKEKAVEQTCSQAKMTAEFLKLYSYLVSRGLNPIVVKGIICRNIYPNPEQRLSSDEDILIPEEQFSEYHKAFIDYGLHVAHKSIKIQKEHEVPYCNDKIYIEVHKKLFPPESDVFGDLNRYFENTEQKRIIESIYGIEISTLDYTDHLFYLICHAYKHFLNCGIGIRIVSDIALFSIKNNNQIDWQAIIDRCKEIGAYTFVSSIYKIGKNHLYQDAFPDELAEIWEINKQNEIPLLQDVVAGGLYGTINESRLHSSNLTLYAIKKSKNKSKILAPINIFFPSLSSMKSRYTYLNRFPFLLPVAWLQRLYAYGRNAIFCSRSGNNANEAVRIGNERVALMKRYKIIEEKKKKDSFLKTLYKNSFTSSLAPILKYVYIAISMIEYYVLNLCWLIMGDKKPTKHEQDIVRNNLTFIIKSFERQRLVKGLCKNIVQMYPGTRIIIADDSRIPLKSNIPELRIIQLPFNSGLSAGLDAALKEVETPFVMRLDDDELLTVRSKIHRELQYLQENPQLDLIGFGHTTAIRLHNPEFVFQEYYNSSMKDALLPLTIPHMTRIDKNHIVLGKVANIYLARTEKMREVGFDPNIKVIDHNDFFWRAAGVMTCALATDTVVFHRHNPYDVQYRLYRTNYEADLMYIKEKKRKMKRRQKNEC